MRPIAFLFPLLAAALVAPAFAAAPAKTVRKTVVVRKTIAADGSVKTVTSTGDARAKAILAGCGARHFESAVEVMDGGSKRMTRIKLCAKPGENDAAWVRSLQSAATTIKGTTTLPQSSRNQIVADLDAEIIKMQSGNAAALSAPLPAPVTDPLSPK